MTGWADFVAAEPEMRVDITSVVHVHLSEAADHLVIDHWEPGRPVQRTRRT